MASNPADEIERTFPREEEFIDHSGRTRRFGIYLRKRAVGDFSLDAIDLSRADGYCFRVYSPAYSVPALGSALGDLRQKIRKGIATRYLGTDTEGQKNPTHDEIHGRISCNGIVVDGDLLQFREFERILITHEGFEISIESAILPNERPYVP
jgi:hypothetical protein